MHLEQLVHILGDALSGRALVACPWGMHSVHAREAHKEGTPMLAVACQDTPRSVVMGCFSLPLELSGSVCPNACPERILFGQPS